MILGNPAFRTVNRIVFTLLMFTLAFSACHKPAESPPEDPDDVPTSSMRLEHAKSLLKGMNSPQTLDDAHINQVEGDFKAIQPNDPEYQEAQRLTKALED